MTVFLINDEDKAAHDQLVLSGKDLPAGVCEQLYKEKKQNRVVIKPKEGVEVVTGTMAVTGTQPHMWFAGIIPLPPSLSLATASRPLSLFLSSFFLPLPSLCCIETLPVCRGQRPVSIEK